MEPVGGSRDHDAPPSRYDPGAPVEGAGRHQVKVTPNSKNKATQIFAALFCLVIGFGALAYAIANPQLPDRAVPVVAGSIVGVVGLLLCLMLKRVLHTRTYTFTDSAFEGEDYSHRTFELPWSDVAEITIQAYKKRSFLRSLWMSLFVRRAFRNPSTAYLRLRLRQPVDRGKALTSLGARQGTVKVPFWNQPELIDSLAHGCRTYAADRFRGVDMS
ncbi:hypothetical protein [Ruania zhangjianzhongii]|uniref:hypothetical protein n=1 Tax=Ruania zhangjianzhongii TaxID=2603206 RepID=UPI0011CC1AE5|nr:hypothetical protein [Ruania zhangjianzhongii]